MEKLLFLYLLLPLFLTLQFYPVPILSHPYNFPDKFFIHCGSGSTKRQQEVCCKSVQDTNQSTTEWPLYKTARFYRRPFSYEFDITDKGLHAVRLHFFPFLSNKANLADALFNVSASNKSLVSNLSFRNITSFPLIKDFLVPINLGCTPINSASFRIHFIPAFRTSFAFVNAIEVFRIPNLKDNRIHVTSTGSKGPFKGLTFQVLRTVMRVNVGGQSFSDPSAVASLWLANDNYIFIGNSSKRCTYLQNGRVNYSQRLFMSCRKVILNDGQASNSTNITWHFKVSKNARHLVRAYFCDIIANRFNTMYFSLFIYSKYKQEMSPNEDSSFTAIPFYYDFVELAMDKYAYLSGLEIMEFIKEPSLEIEIRQPKGKHAIFILTGSVVGFLVICGLMSSYLGTGTRSVNPPPFPNLKLKMSFAEIVEATKNFEAKLLIEKGGFGKVYRGTLRNGLKVALSRLEICIGAAEGLHYLHTSSDGGIIHRDVKSTNILLDEGYVAKVVDFGLSRSGLLDPAERSIGVKGNFGYLDPEYFKCLQFTEKSDVYLFGVVLLEVLSARPAIITSQRMEEINLAEWGLSWLKKRELEKIIDPSPTRANRPTMHEVCWDLKYTLQLQQTTVCREPHEESAMDPSLDSSSQTFQHLPSNSFPMEKDFVPMEKDDGSATTSSGVFSQLKIDDGR
ncbi:hypothetical protein E1A91_A11G237500v1 [Gossypium mustelinum]|uniref:Protein kinase domain-containing protein n=1 Tax=Gossypium mustelinum TaxID=34275 RepID=A0A5D2X9Y4_GOSMU|nr:hypothetical protein E1A91_A11G237500v1 [Gossypium mustelinum]